MTHEPGVLCQTIYENTFQVQRSNNHMLSLCKGSIVLILIHDKTRHLCNVVSSSGVGWIWQKNLCKL